MKVLPFARGETWGGIKSGRTLAGTEAAHLEGEVFDCVDTIHGTGKSMKLRVLRMSKTGNYTVVAGAMMGFTTASQAFGKKCIGQAAAAGAECKPIDPAYAAGTVIPTGDLFTVVEEGPAYALTTSLTSCNLAAHAQVAVAAGGKILGAAAGDGQAIIGEIDAATTAVDTVKLIWVQPGFGRQGG